MVPQYTFNILQCRLCYSQQSFWCPPQKLLLRKRHIIVPPPKLLTDSRHWLHAPRFPWQPIKIELE